MAASKIANQILSRRDWDLVSSAFKSALEQPSSDGWIRHRRSPGNGQERPSSATPRTLLRDFIARSWRRRRPANEFTSALHELGFTDKQISALAVLAMI